MGKGGGGRRRGGGVCSSKGSSTTQPQKFGPFQLQLKFGQQAYCVVELRRGEDAAEVAKKLRDLAAQVEARSK
jgi:hypothetical protein